MAAKYNTSQYAYPSDVGFSPDMKHYVEFYINVRSGSKFNTNNRLPDEPLDYVGGTSLDSDQSRTNAMKNSLTAAKYLGAVGTVGSGLSGSVGGVAGGAGTSVAAQQGLNALNGDKNFMSPLVQVDKPVRTSDVIVLHLQEPPSVRYNVNYTDVELGALVGFLSGVNDASSVFKEDGGLTGFGEEALGRLAFSAASLPAAIAGGGSFVQNVVGAVARKRVNPFREVLFESVDYRTFNFRFRFMPKHEGESQAAKQIINKFKEHMHPELSDDKFFYVYPSEFQIKYMYAGAENEYMNKIAQCALVDLQVEYGGDKFASFKDSGAPVETILTLTFRELVLHTKESITRGY